MTQNIYDDPGFFAGYGTLDRSVRGLDGAPEWPALRALLPPLAGLRVADLGCGYGWFCRFATEQGARHVLGLDVSEKMLARAAEMTSDPTIEYRRADLETLTLPDTAFDLVYSSLAFHYIEDLPRLFGAIRRALVPGAPLVFSIEHPIYMAPARPGFVTNDDGRKRWPVDSYQTEGRRVTDWFAPGVVKHHRKLATLVNALIGAGLALAHLDEWGPTDAQVDAQPALADERERPMMLLVAARRAPAAE